MGEGISSATRVRKYVRVRYPVRGNTICIFLYTASGESRELKLALLSSKS